MPHFFSNFTYSINRITVTGNYTIDDSDCLIGCNHSGEITLTLPASNEVNVGRIYYIKDESGNASTNNIIVEGNGSETIDGNANITVSGDYDCLTIYCAGSGKWFVF